MARIIITYKKSNSDKNCHKIIVNAENEAEAVSFFVDRFCNSHGWHFINTEDATKDENGLPEITVPGTRIGKGAH